MSIAVRGHIIALTIGVGVHLTPTDAAGESCLDEGARTDARHPMGIDSAHPIIIPFEYQESGTATEPALPCVPPITVTALAGQRDSAIAGSSTRLAMLVAVQAQKFGLAVRDLVLRGDWADEDGGEFGGVVLDVFVEPGDADARFSFWDALTDSCQSAPPQGSTVPLSVMVHVS